MLNNDDIAGLISRLSSVWRAKIDEWKSIDSAALIKLGFLRLKEIGLIFASVAANCIVGPITRWYENKGLPNHSDFIWILGFAFLCYSGTILYGTGIEQQGGDVKNKRDVKKAAWRVGLCFLVGCACVLLSYCQRMVTEEIRIGIIAPLTGDVASYGERVRNAAQLAMDEINARSGNDKQKLTLVFEDDQCKPEKAVTAYKKLISADKVNMIVGPICSSSTYAVGQIAQKDQIVIFTPVSSADNISDIGDYVFRLAPYDSLQGEIVAKWLHARGFQSVAILHINNDYGVGLKKSFQERFSALGGQIASVESFDQGETSLRTQWQKIKQSGAQAVFAPAYPKEAVIVLTQHKEMGIGLPLFGTDPYHDPIVLKTAKEATEGIEFTDVAKGSSAEWDKFAASYKARFGVEPNIVAAQSYDAVKVAHYVISKFGTESKKIKDGMSQLKGYKGATGLIEFNEKGDCVTTTFDKFRIERGVYTKAKQ